MNDPFEEEARRRAEAIDRTDADRLEAIAEDEEPVEPKGDGLTDDTRAIQRMYDRANQVPEARPLPPRIGSWEPGNSKQDLQSMRFEIEAERALQLGKPVPKDEELKRLHLKLNEVHVAYQRSGDASLLVAIADLKAQYEERRKAVETRKQLFAEHPVEKSIAKVRHKHLNICVTTSRDYEGKYCTTHNLPICQSDWKEFLLRDEKRMRQQAEEHTEECALHTYPATYGECHRHGWPVNWEEWQHYAEMRWPQEKAKTQKPPLTFRESEHLVHCVDAKAMRNSTCSRHVWPVVPMQWEAHLERKRNGR